MKSLFRQLGFLYLRTGANGSGKTLFTLKDVREKQLKENRPVCYNGRFDLVANFGWKKIDAKDWQLEPDGTIFLFDEAHNDFPKRGTSEAVPDHVKMLAEHRRRGFDFYLITQHPMNLDAFVRRLIGEPGWHSHLKRTPGAAMVSELRWAAVNPQCEKPGSGQTGEVTMRPFPKEVYAWYNSATLHTAKPKLPRAVWIALACLLAVPVLGYSAFSSFTASLDGKKTALGAPQAGASAPRLGRPVPNGSRGVFQAGPGGMSGADYVAARVPRIAGFSHTAPAFDAVTAPAVAPYPAACVSGKNRRLGKDECACYTQQGTRLQVPSDVCGQIVANGFFIEWQQPVHAAAVAVASTVVDSVPVRPEPAPLLVAASPAGSALPAPAVTPAQARSAASVTAFNALVQTRPDDSGAVQLGAMLGAMRRGERILP